MSPAIALSLMSWPALMVAMPVAYTQLTLSTNREGEITGVAVHCKKNNRNRPTGCTLQPGHNRPNTHEQPWAAASRNTPKPRRPVSTGGRQLRWMVTQRLRGTTRVTGPAAAERVFAAAGSPDKTWHLYPESRHELFDDLDRPAVLADLGTWLEIHGA